MTNNKILIADKDILSEFDKFNEFVLENIRVMLPEKIKAFYVSKKNREKIVDKYGDSAFLLPKKLKFPILDPTTGKPHCGLIYAARVRARQWMDKKSNYREVANKAEDLYKKYNCEKKIHVQLKETGEIIDLYELVVMM